MPDLDPATKEVWAGLREITARKSEVSEEVAQLRSNLTGYTAYKNFLDTQSTFSALESDLQTRYDDVPEITNADISATVDDLEANFTDHDSYESGADNETSWDGYRSYLTTNGLTSVEADRNIQLLQLTFDPGQTFKDDSASFGSFSDFETYLTNNGFSSSEATVFRDKVEQRFASFSDFDSTVLQDATPLQKLLSTVAHLTEAGGVDAASALRIFDKDGLAIDGTSVSAGGITLRGVDIADITDSIPDSGTDEGSAITYSNIQLDDASIALGNSTQVSASVENTSSAPVFGLTVPLLIDGAVEKRKQGLSIDANTTRTVVFDVGSGLFYGDYVLRIGSSSTVTLQVTP